MACLRHEMIQKDPKKLVSRVNVWIRAYLKKDGTASSEEVTQSLERIEEYRRTQTGDGSHINRDAINHVYGPERSGRVMAGGFGVTPSKLGRESVSNSNMEKMQKHLTELEAQVHELKSFIFNNELNRQGDKVEGMQDSASTPTQDGTQVKKTTDGRGSSNNVKNARCKLLDWTRTTDVVGEGKIASTNLQSQVHHVMLGEDCWKVWVIVALKNTPLYCPTSEFLMLNDAVGSTIAWPKKYIVLD